MASHENVDERMAKTIAVLREDLNTVRAGRANPRLLDKVVVSYYGVDTPLKNLANIASPDPHSLLITPFDPKSIGDIERGINQADLGIAPTNDGKCVRLVVPQLTEERRVELTKQVRKMGEEAKIAIRNIRRDANDKLKKEEKAGDLSEDSLKTELDEVQKIVEKAIAQVDVIIEAKDKEIMEV